MHAPLLDCVLCKVRNFYWSPLPRGMSPRNRALSKEVFKGWISLSVCRVWRPLMHMLSPRTSALYDYPDFFSFQPTGPLDITRWSHKGGGRLGKMGLIKNGGVIF